MYKSLLVAVDGSKQSKKALSLACHLAKQDDAEVHLVHVPEALPHEATLIWGIGAVAVEDSRKDLETTGQKILARAELEARELGVTRVHTHLAQGEPARSIIRQAETLGVDVIVMGSRGLGNLAGLMMGSVSHKISHNAKCGVIIIR